MSKNQVRIKQMYACRVNEGMLCICNVPYAETGDSFCLSSYSIYIVCLDVAGHVYELMLLLLYV
jgi:hypothetical protein